MLSQRFENRLRHPPSLSRDSISRPCHRANQFGHFLRSFSNLSLPKKPQFLPRRTCHFAGFCPVLVRLAVFVCVWWWPFPSCAGNARPRKFRRRRAPESPLDGGDDEFTTEIDRLSVIRRHRSEHDAHELRAQLDIYLRDTTRWKSAFFPRDFSRFATTKFC